MKAEPANTAVQGSWQRAQRPPTERRVDRSARFRRWFAPAQQAERHAIRVAAEGIVGIGGA